MGGCCSKENKRNSKQQAAPTVTVTVTSPTSINPRTTFFQQADTFESGSSDPHMLTFTPVLSSAELAEIFDREDSPPDSPKLARPAARQRTITSPNYLARVVQEGLEKTKREPSPHSSNKWCTAVMVAEQIDSKEWKLYLVGFEEDSEWLLGEPYTIEKHVPVEYLIPISKRNAHQRLVNTIFNAKRQQKGHWDNLFSGMLKRGALKLLQHNTNGEEAIQDVSINMSYISGPNQGNPLNPAKSGITWCFQVEFSSCTLSQNPADFVTRTRHGNVTFNTDLPELTDDTESYGQRLA